MAKTIYTVELTAQALGNLVTIDVEAKDFGEAEKKVKKEYDWAKPVIVKNIRVNEQPGANYSEKTLYVPMKGSIKSDLSCYLLMTTCHRKEEQEAWERLSQEVEEDGTPKFPHAASNASFWAELCKTIDGVIKTLDQI